MDFNDILLDLSFIGNVRNETNIMEVKNINLYCINNSHNKSQKTVSIQIVAFDIIIKNIKNIVELFDDSKGYDILSFEEDGSERYIEVKSTKNQTMNKGSFYINENERKCAKGKNYWIYYVTGIDSDSPVINLIENPFETEQLSLTPVNYKASFTLSDKS